MESNKLPFHHVDLWVPNYSSEGIEGHSIPAGIEKLSLYHAGFKSRRDIDDEMVRALQEFGVYSSYFAFEPGNGLPGRVFASGMTLWECDLQNRDPNDFYRVEGAELYGVKTALAIPINTATMGRVVVLLYCSENVPEDTTLAQTIAAELTKYSLEPRWKPVLDSKASSQVQSLTKLHKQEKTFAEDHSITCVSNYPYGFTTITNDSNGDSRVYLKASGTVASSNSSLSKIVKSQKMTEIPDSDGSYKLPPDDEIQMTHYLHKFNVGVLGSEVGEDDQEFASFFNKNMPAADEASSSDMKTLRPYFLSFRLLLLRPSSERSSRENEIVGILKKSFRAYARDNRRNGKELANLLVKDWVYLKSTYSFQDTAVPRKESVKLDSSSLPITSMSHMLVKSSAVESYKAIASVPPKMEQQISSDYQGAGTLHSIHPIEPTSKQFVSDLSEHISDQSSRVSEASYSSSCKLVVDHKRYLPRKSSMDSVQHTTSGV